MNTTPIVTTTFTAAAQSIVLQGAIDLSVFIASGGTGTIFLQVSFDNGSNWHTVENGTFAGYPITQRVGKLSRNASWRLLTDTGFTGSAVARLEDLAL